MRSSLGLAGEGLDLSGGPEFHGQGVARNGSVGVSVRPVRLAVGFHRVPGVAATTSEGVVRTDALTRVDVTRARCFCLAFKA